MSPARLQLVLKKRVCFSNYFSSLSLVPQSSHRRTLRCGRAPPTACTSRRATRSTAPSAAATSTRRATGWCSNSFLSGNICVLILQGGFCSVCKAAQDDINYCTVGSVFFFNPQVCLGFPLIRLAHASDGARQASPNPAPHLNVCTCCCSLTRAPLYVCQAEEGLAEEKVHGEERVPHHLARHGQWNDAFISDGHLNASLTQLLSAPLPHHTSTRPTVHQPNSTCSPARSNTTPRRRGASTLYHVGSTFPLFTSLLYFLLVCLFAVVCFGGRSLHTSVKYFQEFILTLM